MEAMAGQMPTRLDPDVVEEQIRHMAALPKKELGAVISRIALQFDFDTWQFAVLEEADRRLTQQE